MHPLAKFYKRLPVEERNHWYDTFRRFYLSNQSEYPSFARRASSDMQRLFTDWVNMETTERDRPFPKVEIVSREFGKMADKFLKEMTAMRKDYLMKHHPEVFI
jgi:hypothetical protein